MREKNYTEIENDFGNAIRKTRIRKGYSLEDVAAMANLSANAVRSLELGRGSSLSTLLKVLRVLDEMKMFTDWIDASQGFSPIEALRQSQRRAPEPRRVSRRIKKTTVDNHDI
jgi:transcriptional regulator with XRE-family HTH domain